MALLMKGVKNANRKFQIQFAAVDRLPCLARVRVGNVSPMRIQTPLPNVSRSQNHSMQILTVPKSSHNPI